MKTVTPYDPLPWGLSRIDMGDMASYGKREYAFRIGRLSILWRRYTVGGPRRLRTQWFTPRVPA